MGNNDMINIKASVSMYLEYIYCFVVVFEWSKAPLLPPYPPCICAGMCIE